MSQPPTRTVFIYPKGVYLPEKVFIYPKRGYLSGKEVICPEKRLFVRKRGYLSGNSALLPETVLYYRKTASFTGKQCLYPYSESGHVQWCRLCADSGYSKHPFVTNFVIFDILDPDLLRSGHGGVVARVVGDRVMGGGVPG